MKVKNLCETKVELVHEGTVSAWTLFKEDEFQSNILWFNDNLVQPGVAIEPHSHEDIEEIYYIVQGRGKMKVGEEEKDVAGGDAIYLPPLRSHSLKNTGTFPLRFICLGGRATK